MLYIIDGNNAMGRLGIGGEKPEQRNALIRKLLAGNLHGGGDLWVVFDGHMDQREDSAKGVKRFYAPVADDKIVSMVGGFSDGTKHNTTVVTSDEGLHDRIYGKVYCIKVEKFFKIR